MTAVISKWFEIFASETGILGEIRQYQGLGIWVMMLIGFLACFFGFKVYRALFSVSFFLVIALVSSVVLGSRTDWGSVVTFFSVAGITLAVLGYGWHRLGGFLVCAFAGAMIASGLSTSVRVILGTGAAFGLLVLVFPVITICFTTALWGGWLLWDTLGLIMVIDGQLYGLLLSLMVEAGFLVQLLMNRKQKLFSKVCPDRIRYWMEKRRQRPA